MKLYKLTDKLPRISRATRIRFAIYCARAALKGNREPWARRWRAWARDWCAGKRGRETARAAAEAVGAASAAKAAAVAEALDLAAIARKAVRDEAAGKGA